MPGRGPQRPITPGERTAPQPPLREDLAELTLLALEVVTEREAVAEWNEWVERYHPQGYRQPIGAHLRYFLRDRHGRQLGCLLFGFATRNLECRDSWIGCRSHSRCRPRRSARPAPRFTPTCSGVSTGRFSSKPRARRLANCGTATGSSPSTARS